MIILIAAIFSVLALVFASYVLVARMRARAEPPLRGVAVLQIGKETELELSNGERYRTEWGFVWHHFPYGESEHHPLSRFLQDEKDRLEKLKNWTEGA